MSQNCFGGIDNDGDEKTIITMMRAGE